LKAEQQLRQPAPVPARAVEVVWQSSLPSASKTKVPQKAVRARVLELSRAVPE